jgi:signal transduction histidine kinase
MLHYLTPQVRLLSDPANTFLSRHAVERIIFVLPVSVAASAFGLRGGMLTSALAVLIMLPRAIWISAYPADALLEVVAAGLVACLVGWMIAAQQREKMLHQRSASRLSVVNAITAIVSRSLDLEQIVRAALVRTLDVTGFEAGLVLSLNNRSQELVLVAEQGIPHTVIAELRGLQMSASAYGRATLRGALTTITDYTAEAHAMEREGLQTQVAIPLKSKEQVRGVLVLASWRSRTLLPQEKELLTAVGNGIGVALENARLYERMRFYARQIIQAQEEERQRIARELHDEMLQQLIVLSRRLDAWIVPSQPLCTVPTERLASLQELIRDMSSDMRRFVRDLRPSTLDHLGLVPALRGLMRGLETDHEIAAQLQVVGSAERLLPDQELTLFRVAQEALSNVRRHANAAQVSARIEFSPAQVQMTIEDDGDGFHVPEAVDDYVAIGKLGLAGMDERARSVGGTFTLRSQRGHGTAVSITIPIGSEPRHTADKE